MFCSTRFVAPSIVLYLFSVTCNIFNYVEITENLRKIIVWLIIDIKMKGVNYKKKDEE